MDSKLSRKHFLKLGSLAGAGYLLAPRLSFATDLLPAPAEYFRAGPEYISSGDPRYDELRRGYNKRVTHAPAVIARCTNTQDVSEAALYARKHQIPIAIRSAGHNFEGYSSNDGGMMIDLSQLDGLKLSGLLNAGPGARLASLYDYLLPRKQILPAGSCGTVGLGGLALGGGYGFFSRKYGLTCDNLVEATIIDGSGEVRSTRDDSELLWALRGGGTGGLAIVTEMTFKTHPAPASFTSHHFKSRGLTAEHAVSMLETWFDETRSLPEACFSAFVLNGKTLNILVTNYERSTDTLESALAKLRAISADSRSSHPLPLARALKAYYGSLRPLYFKNASAGLYTDFGEIAQCIEQVLEIVTSTPGMIYQVNTLGGAIGSLQFEAGSCFPHRAKNYLSELQTYWDSPKQELHLIQKFNEVQRVFTEHGITAQYSNYCASEFTNWEQAYYGKYYPRLQSVKKKYDPDNIFRHPQSIRA